MTQLDINDTLVQQELAKHVGSTAQPKKKEEPAPTEAAPTGLKFQVELTPQQAAVLIREATIVGLTPKEHLHNLITSKVFDTSVGRTLISKPSKVNGISTSHIKGVVR